MLPQVAAAYLRVENGEAAFIETNTAHAAPKLLAALEQSGVAPEAVRYVIVTHVHLDHAGGASELMKACPNAILLAHPRATRHLIDPSKLVASATAVYGAEKFAQLYGTIEAIDPTRVRALDDGASVPFAGSEFRFIHTRGHANHHFVVHDLARETVFTGDAFGLVYPQLQRGTRFAFPSTSPTDFDAIEALASIDKILALQTKSACLTHFGEVHDLDVIATQLRSWIETSQQLVEKAAALTEMAGAAEAFIRASLAVEMTIASLRSNITLDAVDEKLLALDLDLNAQGLLHAARKQKEPAPKR